ncbi:M17 family metallopeptidase [Microbacterium trichothecenolyticum]|uniref:M17 family metallopeptidase n=1 Tax=Microbacterium trichothecenolyticum TaxID=69370 RepID=UPI0027D7A416|nr:M17 family metallopeptidase [Microbacterium trichothecenolyticum]
MGEAVGLLGDNTTVVVPVRRDTDTVRLDPAATRALDAFPEDVRIAVRSIMLALAPRLNEEIAVTVPVCGPRPVWWLALCVLDDALPRAEALFAAALASGHLVESGRMLSLLACAAASAPEEEVVAAGHAIGRWRWTSDDDEPVEVTLIGETDASTAWALERARIIATEADAVRRLVETPPNALTPRGLAEHLARRIAGRDESRLTAEIWDSDELRRRGFGATLAVGEASAQEPCALVLRLDGDGPLWGLAGKGITFDSGGLNLKRDPAEIAWMKSDMAAAASVASAMMAAADLGPGRPALAVLPLAENAVGPQGLRPGDVVTHPNGRLTEVVDTDSEGRLVLADALAWLVRADVKELVDVGTLSDSGDVGTSFWGCWSTSDALAQTLVDAGYRVGEPGWRLPLHPGYRRLLSSRVADSANAPTGIPDSGQLAATFLRPFAMDVPWAHIDNGSGAYLVVDADPWPAGPTAVPLRTLIEILRPHFR